ncbi:MAG: hypothetical protein J0L78_10215 [Planctomycetes bacterium]|nr:hypothetical protein [Planctomycetota bacterium]
MTTVNASSVATNFDSSVSVGYGSMHVSMNTTRLDGFRYTRAQGLTTVDYVGPPPLNKDGTLIYAVSADGNTIAGTMGAEDDPTGTIRWPFKRIGSTMTYLPLGTADYGYGYDVSNDGNVVVGYTSKATLKMGCRWLANGTRQDIGVTPGGTQSLARLTNNDGSVIVGWSDTTTLKPIRWTQASGVKLYAPLTTGTPTVNCLAGTGAVAGGSCSPGVATLWFDPATPVNFGTYLQSLGADITGWSAFSEVLAISADGMIMYGTGTFNGVTTSWRVDLNGSCPADFNNDLVVDDADFAAFASAYDTLDCGVLAMPIGCPADLNGDGLVEDGDFVLFVMGYDALECP